MEIRIENLTRYYGEQLAVDHLSFEVKPGEILGFLGPNGAGKSTTMKMITTWLSIGGGDIFIGGRSVRNEGEKLRAHIGYLPENNPLYEEMAVVDYLSFSAAIQGVEKNKIPERVKEMVKRCGLEGEKHKVISELSKGYRQRVGLAQALVHDPPVLILDEPTTGLDPNQIAEIRNLIRELGKAKTVILSTHILPEVEAICDRVIIISKGKIVANGTTESLRRQQQGQQSIQIKIEDGASAEIAIALASVPGVLQVTVLSPAEGKFSLMCEANSPVARNIFQLCVSRKWTLTQLTPAETRLEDIFRELTLASNGEGHA